MPSLRATWNGDRAFLEALRARAGRLGQTALLVSVGAAAVRIQDAIRRNAEAMIYSQPPAASGYKRTRTLFRSIHAAPPGVDHSTDEARASSGIDLGASAQSAAGAVGGGFTSEVGSWISYADKVHEGVNQPNPRPYVDAAAGEAENIMAEEMEKHAARMFS